jgi:hypothetical protein
MAVVEVSLQDMVTFVITTSPTRENPSTAMLEDVMASVYERLVGVRRCRKIIVCDGFIVDDEASKTNKLGRIMSSRVAPYLQFCDNVERLCRGVVEGPFAHCEVVRQAERRGFAGNVHDMLAHVKTPMVMVWQHDWLLCRGVDLVEVCRSVSDVHV